MRKLVLLAVVAAAISAAPRAATAQYTIRNTESARADLDPAQKARFEAAKGEIQALIQAQEAYFKAHGRYAAELGDLTEFALRQGSIVSMTGGPDWFVALAGDLSIGIQQVVVRRDGGVAAAATASPR
ncbi:MAG TPA: hypothetical protein VFQ39_05320 [Longimicrobium sp.]|nr:hypothetical protein [Longimicrobium sp.]